MRLSELKLDELKFSNLRWLKNTKHRFPIEIATYLENNGYKTNHHLQGSFSTVFLSKTSNIAVKVSSETDTGWMAFAKFCQEHKRNPHLPKIASKIIEFKSPNAYDDKNPDFDCFIAFCEKLEPITAAPDRDLKMLSTLMFMYGQSLYGERAGDYWFSHIKTTTSKPVKKRAWKSGYANMPPSKSDKANDLVEVRKWLKENPFLLPTLKMVKTTNFSMDLHDDNIMYRPSNNKFVLIDPYFYEGQPLPT